MKSDGRVRSDVNNRPAFLKNGAVAASAAAMGAGLFGGALPAFAHHDRDGSGSLTSGDAAILRFLAAAEILETDL